jgi:hypothetical protein
MTPCFVAAAASYPTRTMYIVEPAFAVTVLAVSPLICSANVTAPDVVTTPEIR